MLLLWLSVCILLNFEGGLGSSICSCSDSKLCGPVKGNAFKSEVVGFSYGSPNSGYQRYDWKKLTTLVLVYIRKSAINDIVCLAHKNNVKVQVLVRFSTKQLLNSTFRENFINETVSTVQRYNLDGVNIDYEDAVTHRANVTMTHFMEQMRRALKKANPLYGLSLDYVFCERCSPSRTFDILNIRKHIDFLILMDYDLEGFFGTFQMRSQTFCCNVFNAPLPAIIRGMKGFLQAGIPASQLVLAFPWYGSYHECEIYDETNHRCFINCANVYRSRHTLSFKSVMALLRSGPYQRMWSFLASVPFFTFKGKDGAAHQINYDDPVSLGMKYNVTKLYKLRGLGIWTIDYVDYSNTNKNGTMDRIQMWNAVPGGN